MALKTMQGLTPTTTVEITMKHPVYYHDGTRCRTWDGDPAAFNL